MDAFLAELPFFRTSASEEPLGFLQRRYRRGAIIFSEGGPPRAAFLLQQGLVKVVKQSPSHRAMAVEIVTPGEMFGVVAVLDRRVFPATAVALDESVVYEIPTDHFESLLTRNPVFAREVHAAVGAHVRNAQEMRALAGEPVEHRIAHVLLRLLPHRRSVARLRREDVAELAGCIPETAIRVLSSFKRRRWIETGWRRIALRDARALRSLVGAR